MNKFKLNYLRWITGGELPDSWLKTAFDFKTKGKKFSFKIRANVNTKNWVMGVGSCE